MPVSHSTTCTDPEKTIRRILLGMFGGAAKVVAFEPYAYATSLPLYSAVVDIAAKRLKLIIKDSGQAASDAATTGRPGFLNHPLREVLVYRECLAELRLGTARFYGSAHDEQLEHVYAVFEQVPGRELWQFGDFDSWLQVAAQLARQHSALQRLLAKRSYHDLPLLDYSERLATTWLERAQRFVVKLPRAKTALTTASRCFTEQSRDFFSQPPTIVHGDFYPANILLQETPRQPTRVCVLDWELAGRGPGQLDLASLIAGRWVAHERRALATAYYEAASETAGNQMDRTLFDQRLAFARLQTAIRWLGWSDSWQPPPQQQNDWLAELEEAVQELSSTALDK